MYMYMYVTLSPMYMYLQARSILRQLEYYFCDENLSKDKFFSQHIAQVSDNDV